MVWVKRAGMAIATLAICYGLDAVLNEFLIEYVVRIVMLAGIYAILAVSLNLINGTTGQFSIGHAGFMAVGAYGCAFVVTSLEDALGPALDGLPVLVAQAAVFIPGLLAGAGLAALAGVLVGVPSLRLRGDYLAIVTLGFGEIIRLVFNNWEALGGATGYSGGRPLGLSAHTNVFWVGAALVLTVLFIKNLTFSSHGRALMAIREDEIAAEAMGIPTTRMKVLSFTISSLFAGVAGGLFAHLQSTIRPDDFKFDRSIDVVAMLIIGGLGSITGSIVGAVFVAVSLELMRDIQQYRLVTYALLLIVLMIVRPEGLLGRRELVLPRFLRRAQGGTP